MMIRLFRAFPFLPERGDQNVDKDFCDHHDLLCGFAFGVTRKFHIGSKRIREDELNVDELKCAKPLSLCL